VGVTTMMTMVAKRGVVGAVVVTAMTGERRDLPAFSDIYQY